MTKLLFATIMALAAIFLVSCVVPVLPELPSDPITDPSQTTTLEESEYAEVFIHTLEESGENEGRSQLSVAYPVTGQDAINERMVEISQPFIDAYRLEAAATEESYQKYKRETGEEAHSFITHYRQRVDVALANENILTVNFVRGIDTGGTGTITVVGYIFDHRTGAEMPIPALFVDDHYLDKLSELTREVLAARVSNNELASDLAWVEQGTTPAVKHFDNLLLNDDGTVQIMFDSYQVAAGVEGIVEVELPMLELADLFKPEIQQLLGIGE